MEPIKSIHDKLNEIGQMQFYNTEENSQFVKLYFMGNNIEYFVPIKYNINRSKIIKNPQKNKLFKKYLLQDENHENHENLVFKIKVFNTTCIFSKHTDYIGQITLNKDPEFESEFVLYMYQIHKPSFYNTEYILIKTYVSQKVNN